jgi:CBS domain-containing protein
MRDNQDSYDEQRSAAAARQFIRTALTPAAHVRTATMKSVRAQMRSPAPTIGASRTIREAARLMSAHNHGAIVVIDQDHRRVGILTERDVIDSVGAGQDPDAELAAHHRTLDVVFATSEWSLEQAAMTMVRAGFRHLVVVRQDQVIGMLSMRDIVRVWAKDVGQLVGTVRDGMTRLVLTIGPTHTLRETARLMSMRRVGAALVIDPQSAEVGILTERDVVKALGAGQDPDTELAAQHRTREVVFATSQWSLEQAAITMVRAGFRHLVITKDSEAVGMLSMRDIARVWADSHAAASTRDTYAEQ